MSKRQETLGQLEIKFNVVKSTEVDGIEMGVLDDETPFLTGRGLARFCGIAASTLFEWGEIAPLEGDRLRMGKMATLLTEHGFDGDRLFLKVPFESQAEVLG